MLNCVPSTDAVLKYDGAKDGTWLVRQRQSGSGPVEVSTLAYSEMYNSFS